MHYVINNNKMSFANKVVIVTGSSSGIGAAAAIAFAREGANVVINGRKEQKLQKVKEQCARAGKEPLLIKADLSKSEDAKKVIDETVKKYGKIDVLVNNAAIVAFNGILYENMLELYDSIMNTNVRAPVYITHLAVPYLIKSKGNIINISSAAAKVNPRQSPSICYSISKAAIDHFTRTVAAELASHGVRVNTISPGPVKTDLLTNANIDMSFDAIKEVSPLGRVSDPEEIADLILYLAGDKAKAITGSDFISDNGFLFL